MAKIRLGMNHVLAILGFIALVVIGILMILS